MSSVAYGPGLHLLSEPLVLDGYGDAVTGAGIGATTLVYTGTGPAIRTQMPEGSTVHQGVRVSGFSLIGGGVELLSTYRARVADLYVRGAGGFGVRVGRADGGAFAAYNVLDGVTVDGAGCPGNGIVLDAGSEFTSVRDCTASYYRQGAVPATHYAEPDLTSGVGLLLASGNNTVSGGHFDRCTVPLAVRFGDNNRLDTATDNAQGSAVVLLGATRTTGTVSVGRMDPHLPDGSPNPRYGASNWRAVHACNVAAGNDVRFVFLRDTDPPPLPAGRASWPLGGWTVAAGQNGGTGQAQYGGENRYRLIPEGLPVAIPAGFGVVLR